MLYKLGTLVNAARNITNKYYKVSTFTKMWTFFILKIKESKYDTKK